jgi:predicted lipid-binding transport protein (Tim44 family)
MKRSAARRTLLVMLLTGLFWAASAPARAGEGAADGSRGSAYSAPATPAYPSRQLSWLENLAAQHPGWKGRLARFVAGGVIGSEIFGGARGGLVGGIGLTELVITAGLIYAGARSFGRPREAATAPAHPSPLPLPLPASAVTAPAPATSRQLEREIRHIRQMDWSFDPVRFAETASDLFFALETAWMARDLEPVRELLTPGMHESLQKECDRLRAGRRINRLEDIVIHSVAMTRAWQEGALDFVTVRFRARLLDYVVDEASEELLEGSRSELVNFEECWTFVRPGGPNPWRLSAIRRG